MSRHAGSRVIGMAVSLTVLLVVVSAPSAEVWYIDDARPYNFWGADTSGAHLESMFDGASSACAIAWLYPDTNYYAQTPPEPPLAEYSGYTFSALLYVWQTPPTGTNPLIATLTVTQGARGVATIGVDTVVVSYAPHSLITIARFDFGVCSYYTSGETLQLTIDYNGAQNAVQIYWDGFAGCNSAVYAWIPAGGIGPDKVVCEYPSDTLGVNPPHPPVYWYDVTPCGGDRSDFHVRTLDGNSGNYTAWVEPAGWTHLVHNAGCNLWISWWDTTGVNPLVQLQTYRFQFTHLAAPAWSDWRTTDSAISDPDSAVTDRSAAHSLQFRGSGYLVHAPTAPANVTLPPDQDATGVFKSDADWADFDGDGDLDLAISGEAASGLITQTYRNDDGELVLNQNLPGVQNESSGNLAWGDYDGDGDEDLAVAGMSALGAIARIYENVGGGELVWDTQQELVPVSLASVAWGDCDGDGDLDLVVTGHTGTQARSVLYRNDPSGILTADPTVPLVGLYAGSADWGDCDGDHDLDLLLTGSDGVGRRTILYENEGHGMLVDSGSHGLPGISLSDAEWGDYDGDGDLDLAFTGEATAALRVARVYRNDGPAVFVVVADLLSIYRSSCAWGDYDNDGDLDVAFCGYTGSGLYTGIYENEGGDFVDTGLWVPGVREGSLAWSDVDCDGDLDFLMTGADWSERYARVYENVREMTLVPGETNGAPVAAGSPLLEVNVPNPFNPQTTVRYTVPTAGPVSLAVYDPTGRLVRRLVEGPQISGGYSVVWDGRDEDGHGVASGIYFCRLVTGSAAETRKMVLVR